MKIRYGGDLRPGDFIAIAESGGYIILGWYFGEGRGTLQYIPIGQPGAWFEHFKLWEGGVSVEPWYSARFKRYGFTSKLFYKAYIYGAGIEDRGTRVMKIQDPESILSNPDDLQEYLKSREALIYIKMLEK